MSKSMEYVEINLSMSKVTGTNQNIPTTYLNFVSSF